MVFSHSGDGEGLGLDFQTLLQRGPGVGKGRFGACCEVGVRVFPFRLCEGRLCEGRPRTGPCWRG